MTGSNGLTTKKMWIFWGRSSTYKGGDRSSDKHQAFNPMIRAIDFPADMRHTIEKRTTCDQLFPNIEFDKQLEEGTVRFQCHFKDPTILATAFNYKGLPTAWTGTGDTMTFNFSNYANIDENIWVQLHIPDPSGSSNHLDIFLDGGRLVSYTISYTQGNPIIEDFQIRFSEINVATDTDSTGAYAPDIDDGFDDGSFNQTGVAEVSTIVAKAAASITDGKYFKIWKANGTGGWTAYYVWFDKVGDESGDPAPTGYTEIKCDISGDTTAQDVSDTIQTAINGITGFTATNGAGTLTTVTVTNDNTGDIKDIVDVDSGLTLAVSTQGVTAADGGWSNWDGAYTSVQCAMAVDCTPIFNGVALTDLSIQTFNLTINVPKTSYRVASSLSVAGTYLAKHEPWKMELTGILTRGNVNLAEPSKTIANKTQGTAKMTYGTTKYFQFTNARIEQTTASGKEAGTVQDSTFSIIAGAGSVLSYVWTATETTDPSNHINHTNV